MTRRPGLALAAILALASCRGETVGQTPEAEEKIIARVNGEKVPRGLFEAYLRDNINLLDDTPRPGETARNPGDTASSGGFTEEVKSRLLDRFLEEQALLAEARDAGIEVGEEELDRFAQAMSLGPLATLHEGAPLTERQYLRKYLEDCYLVKSYLEKKVLAGIAASDEQARAYYDQHESQFSRPDRYRLRVIRVDSLPEAQEIQQRLAKDPAGFARVAQSLSEGLEGDQGKDLGLWRADELPAQVATAVAPLAQGQVSGIVQDREGGFSLYFVESKEEGGTLPFDQALERIRTKVSRDEKARVLAEHLRELSHRVRIQVDREALGFTYVDRAAASPIAAATPATPPATSPAADAVADPSPSIPPPNGGV